MSGRFGGFEVSELGDEYPGLKTTQKILEWQWREKVIPFWQSEAEFAKKNGVDKICIEMHPSFVVYNPETLLKLRESAGKVIGANFRSEPHVLAGD